MKTLNLSSFIIHVNYEMYKVKFGKMHISYEKKIMNSENFVIGVFKPIGY